MFGSEALEIGIGLIFVYLLLSLACTAFTEVVSASIKLRAGVLRDGIFNMLSEKRYTVWEKLWPFAKKRLSKKLDEAHDLGEAFYSHPLIRTLYSKGHGPSYIPARTFALVMLDLINEKTSPGQSLYAVSTEKGGPSGLERIRTFLTDRPQAAASPDAPAPADKKATLQPDTETDFERLRQTLSLLLAEAEQDMLLGSSVSSSGLARLTLEEVEQFKSVREVMQAAEVDLVLLREKIEVWYENTMDRVSGWYKRWTKAVAFIVAVLIAFVTNADTFEITRFLSTNDSVRQALVQQADAYVARAAADTTDGTAGNAAAPADTSTVNAAPADSLAIVLAQARAARQRLDSTMTALQASGLPLGWQPGQPRAWRRAFIGASPFENEQEKALTLIASLSDSLGNTPPLARMASTLQDLTLENAATRGRAALALLDQVRPQPPGSFSEPVRKNIRTLRKQLTRLSNTPAKVPPPWTKLFGLIATALALTLGAPFWFDMLNKIVSIRSSGKSTEEKAKAPEAPAKRPEMVPPQ